jgi:hypothetical protein
MYLHGEGFAERFFGMTTGAKAWAFLRQSKARMTNTLSASKRSAMSGGLSEHGRKPY